MKKNMVEATVEVRGKRVAVGTKDGMDWSNDNCPICNAAAKEALPRMGDFAEFICDGCGRFRITGTALETARHEDNPEIRVAALDRAKARAAADKSMPQITSSDF